MIYIHFKILELEKMEETGVDAVSVQSANDNLVAVLEIRIGSTGYSEKRVCTQIINIASCAHDLLIFTLLALRSVSPSNYVAYAFMSYSFWHFCPPYQSLLKTTHSPLCCRGTVVLPRTTHTAPLRTVQIAVQFSITHQSQEPLNIVSHCTILKENVFRI